MGMSFVLTWTYFKLGVLLNYVAHMCVASVSLFVAHVKGIKAFV
jgi:hypothetical protein